MSDEYFKAWRESQGQPLDTAQGEAPAMDGEVVNQLTHERNLLAEAIANAALKAGIYNGEVPLTGPHLLMLAEDLAAIASQNAVEGEAVATVHVYESATCNGRKMGSIRNWESFVKSLPVGDHPLFARPAAADAGVREALTHVAKLEEVLDDLLSWFDKPSEPEWRIKAGPYGADDAVEAARAALSLAAKREPQE